MPVNRNSLRTWVRWIIIVVLGTVGIVASIYPVYDWLYKLGVVDPTHTNPYDVEDMACYSFRGEVVEWKIKCAPGLRRNGIATLSVRVRNLTPAYEVENDGECDDGVRWLVSVLPSVDSVVNYCVELPQSFDKALEGGWATHESGGLSILVSLDGEREFGVVERCDCSS